MGVARFLVTVATFLIFLASQLFWFRRVAELGEKLIPNKAWRKNLGGVAAIAYIILFAYNLAWVRDKGTPTGLTLEAALVEAPFLCWVVSSLLGFAVVTVFWVADRLARTLLWCYRQVAAAVRAHRRPALQAAVPADAAVAPDPPSRSRRRFLERTAFAVSAAPFVAGAYGLLYGRLNVEITRHRVKLSRLPKAFEGLRIAQLSDIHIGPFMTAEEVRKCVALTNELRPDLVALTGDFINWDPATQEPVVLALAGLKAPLGVFGCLGNHELWTDTEDSIARLFAAQHIRILRRESAPIGSQGATLNLLGVNFESRTRLGPPGGPVVRQYLAGAEQLVMPDTVNILLTHNPNAFDRAAELGIDLTLAGHTHGGQVNLEFIHPSLTPARLITDYVRGWFQKGAAQLYVNRGIGTFGVPIRFGSPPEITVFELVREG
jgi:predicted MPP superfamily phosphohydrolase